MTTKGTSGNFVKTDATTLVDNYDSHQPDLQDSSVSRPVKFILHLLHSPYDHSFSRTLSVSFVFTSCLAICLHPARLEVGTQAEQPEAGTQAEQFSVGTQVEQLEAWTRAEQCCRLGPAGAH